MKIFKSILNAHEGSKYINPDCEVNNYQVNTVIIKMDGDHLISETGCENDFGSLYANNDVKILSIGDELKESIKSMLSNGCDTIYVYDTENYRVY